MTAATHTHDTGSGPAQLRPLPPNTVLPVVGVSHRQNDVRTCTEGTAVIFRHDTANPHDPHAVAVTTLDGRMLGYVPASFGLNARMAGVHPGGMWAGTVSEVLRGETWGLRVRLGRLVDAGDPRYGAQLAATRDRADVDIDGRVEKASDQAGSGVAQVYTSTGRHLGDLVEQTPNRVRVATRSGVVAYPATVVTVKPAPAPDTTAPTPAGS